MASNHTPLYLLVLISILISLILALMARRCCVPSKGSRCCCMGPRRRQEEMELDDLSNLWAVCFLSQTWPSSFHTWPRSDNAASQSCSRCDPAGAVWIEMCPDTGRLGVFTCTFTYFSFFFSLSPLFSLRWLNGPKRKRKNSQCSVKSMTGE